jgi:tetratricopeptide (TPR) repeat protein
MIQPLPPLDAVRADLAQLTAGDGAPPALLTQRLPAWLDLAGRLARGHASPRPALEPTLAEVADMERIGALHLALSTLHTLRTALPKSDPAALALVTAQTGRVYRQLGALDQAKESYERALRTARRIGDAALQTRALLGLGGAAHHRGNYPAADRAYTRALALAPAGSQFVLGAAQGLMITRAVLGQVDDAFHYGWRAFDLSRHRAEEEAEILCNLSDLALRVGHVQSAANGFGVAYARTALERIRFPALRGSARAAALLGDRWDLEVVTERARVEGMRSSLPYEHARLLADLAVAWRTLGDDALALTLTDEALALADRFGFHEIAFQAGAGVTPAPVFTEASAVEVARWRDNAGVASGVRRLAAVA